MPTDSATWRSIRQDFESLPPAGVEDHGAEWSLIWSSRPPVAMFIPVQLQSQWTWFHPFDSGLRARASAIFLKAAKARGYDTEDQWLDELRHADFVRFRLSGSGRERLPDGTFVEHEDGVLKDSIKHSITQCHQLEAGAHRSRSSGDCRAKLSPVWRRQRRRSWRSTCQSWNVKCRSWSKNRTGEFVQQNSSGSWSSIISRRRRASV